MLSVFPSTRSWDQIIVDSYQTSAGTAPLAGVSTQHSALSTFKNNNNKDVVLWSKSCPMLTILNISDTDMKRRSYFWFCNVPKSFQIVIPFGYMSGDNEMVYQLPYWSIVGCAVLLSMTQPLTCRNEISFFDTYQNTSKKATSLKYTLDCLPSLIQYCKDRD